MEKDLLQRLEIHRRNLSHYLAQLAKFTIAFVPPQVIHGIEEQRDEIQKIKYKLKGMGIKVMDYPDDEEISTTSDFSCEAAISEQPSLVPHSFFLPNQTEVCGYREIFRIVPSNSSQMRIWQQFDPPYTKNVHLSFTFNEVCQIYVLNKTGGFSVGICFPGIGTWLMCKESIYALNLQPKGSIYIYFNVLLESSESIYLIYTNTQYTHINIHGELVVSFVHDYSMNDIHRSLCFNIQKDLEDFFHLTFKHLNWICFRGDIEISRGLAVSDIHELEKIWANLSFPLLVDGKK